jgi:hypothetical protein
LLLPTQFRNAGKLPRESSRRYASEMAEQLDPAEIFVDARWLAQAHDASFDLVRFVAMEPAGRALDLPHGRWLQLLQQNLLRMWSG